MGGHGGLNILPQKRWNVYNFDNREKVRKDEEAAAREEQIKREESRRREFEFRLQTLRHARNPISNPSPNPNPSNPNPSNPNPSSSGSNHINLFDNLADISALGFAGNGKEKKTDGRDDGDKRKRKRKEEAAAKVVITAEDEKYRLGYGLMGKGVEAPWYLSKSEGFVDAEEKERGKERSRSEGKKSSSSSRGKKSIEELREERIRRERKEKERERAVVRASAAADKGFSRRRM